MKRGQYVRISAFMLTNLRNTPDLYTLAVVSIPIWVAEGWLLVHVQPPEPIRLVARIREGKSCRGIFTSAPTVRVRNGYVLTQDTLYQVLRVPPSHKETFAPYA